MYKAQNLLYLIKTSDMKNLQITIKKVTLLIIMVSSQILIEVKAENNPVDSQIKDQPQVVVNKDMIDRFNSCDTDSMLVSWSGLVMGFDSENLMNLYLAYQNADLENQSLEDIKLALQNKQTEHLSNSNIESDLAWFNQVKQEINNKLRATELVVQK